jgi:hypothetical protein
MPQGDGLRPIGTGQWANGRDQLAVDAPSILGPTQTERCGCTFSTMTDPEIQKAWGPGRVRKGEASNVPTAAKAAKAFADRVCFRLAFGQLYRDRSLADGHLKNQRTDRRYFDLSLGFETGTDLENWGQVLKDETSLIPSAAKASGGKERDRPIADGRLADLRAGQSSKGTTATEETGTV